jgi:hypothetical protein
VSFGVICYVIGAQLLPASIANHVPLSQLLYFHAESRFAYEVIIAFAALAAIGLDAWLEERRTARRIMMIVPGVLVWFVLSPVIGVPLANLQWLFVGGVVGTIVLAAVHRRAVLVLLVPAAVALELLANAVIWAGAPRSSILSPRGFGLGALPVEFTAARDPNVDLNEYLRPGPIAETIASGSGRYLTLVPRGSIAEEGTYRLHQPSNWPALAAQQSMLFGLDEAQGYNPVQLRRFWNFVRVANERASGHEMPLRISALIHPSDTTLDLFDVEWVIAPAGYPPDGGWTVAAREGNWTLFHRVDPISRASLLYGWSVVADEQASLSRVNEASFDPEREVVLERDPGIPPTLPPISPGTATYTYEGTQGARVDVSTPRAAVLLVRNSYDTPWRATIDGHSTDVLVADSMLQAVVVPAGHHVVQLRYDDPTIAVGLVISMASLIAFAVIALGLEARDRRSRRTEPVVLPDSAGPIDQAPAAQRHTDAPRPE